MITLSLELRVKVRFDITMCPCVHFVVLSRCRCIALDRRAGAVYIPSWVARPILRVEPPGQRAMPAVASQKLFFLDIPPLFCNDVSCASEAEVAADYAVWGA